MRHLIFTVLIICSYSFGALAAVSKSSSEKRSVAQEIKSKKHKKSKKRKISEQDKWNSACDDLLKNSVKSTIALEKSLKKQKKKLSRMEFDEKVQNELLVVQLNAWVCAVSSHDKVGAVIEEQFLKEYAEKVQDKKKL